MTQTGKTPDEGLGQAKGAGGGCLLWLIGLCVVVALLILVPYLNEQREQERLHVDDMSRVVEDVTLVDPEGRYLIGPEARLVNDGGEGIVTVVMQDTKEHNRTPVAQAELHYAPGSPLADGPLVCEARRSYFWSDGYGGEVDLWCPTQILLPDQVERVVVRP
ncbi:hypothetical protein [Cellulosimicrobium funkei]